MADDAHDGATLPTPDVSPNPETEPYWAAAAEGRLLVMGCNQCGRVYHPPRARCPDCLSDDTEWVEASGEGEIYAHAVTRQMGPPYAESTPYVVAYVELAEGPRMLTNVVTDDPEALSVGQAVAVVFDETDDGEYAIPRFEPV
jgi:uncharacterized OB-fold protein